ncbi:unnamed protein product [Clavelina lepadiformis]|uniref:BTB domain-containing protein n=1 Tax=Clavelina lepadiformis TaxID=159417 RepID=A0ABP0GN41_CLALP
MLRSTTSEKLRSRILQRKLQEDYKVNKSYCDFLIRVEKQEFHVHKCVVGIFSIFFKAMFASSMKENFENEVTIHTVSAETMVIVIDFIYGDDVEIKRGNVYDLLAAADFLQIFILRRTCQDYLENNVSSETVLTDWIFLKRYHIRSGKIEEHISENLQSILEEKAVLELDGYDFRHLLNLTGKKWKITPSQRYKYIMSWIEQDPNARKKYLDMLIKDMKLNSLPKKFLTDVVLQNDWILNSPITMSRGLEAKTQLSDDDFSGDSKVAYLTSFDCRSKFPKSVKFQLRMFRADTEDWKELGFVSPKYKNAGLVIDKDRLYMIGGYESDISYSLFSGNKSSNEARYLDRTDVSLGWKDMTSMHTPRQSFGCAVYEDCIYVSGGVRCGYHWEKRIFVNKVECYNVNRQVWVRKAPMIRRRARHSLVAHRGLLYALGGDSSSFQSVECYDGRKWKYVASMNNPRKNFSTVVLNGQIYAIGGGHGGLFSIEFFDPRVNAWYDVACLKKLRFGHVYACVANHKIYAMDDMNQSVEVYDPVVDRWHEIVSMPANNTF